MGFGFGKGRAKGKGAGEGKGGGKGEAKGAGAGVGAGTGKGEGCGKARVTGRGSDGAVDAVADAAEESVDLGEDILAGGTDMDIPIGIQDRPIDEGGGGLAGQAGAVHMAVLAY